jgi:hypothetical protein
VGLENITDVVAVVLEAVTVVVAVVL